jgi:hypothetical protein
VGCGRAVGLGRGFLCVGRRVGRGEGVSCGAISRAAGTVGGISRIRGAAVGTGVASMTITIPCAAVGLRPGAAIRVGATVGLCVGGATAVSIAVGRDGGSSSSLGETETAGTGVGEAFGGAFVAATVGAGRDGILSSTVGRTGTGTDVGEAFGCGLVAVAGGGVAGGLDSGFGGAKPPVRARIAALPASASLASSYTGSQCLIPGVDSRSFLLLPASSKSAPEE